MAFNVRLFGYRGIVQMPMINVRQFNADSVFLLEEPFIWAQTIEVSSVAATSAAMSGGQNDNVRLLRIEVPDAQAIRYRITPYNYDVVAANTDCPRLSGFDNFKFAPGWRISLIDAAGLP